MMMVRLKNLASNINNKIKIQNVLKMALNAKQGHFFIFARLKIKFKKNKMRLNRFKIEIKDCLF